MKPFSRALGLLALCTVTSQAQLVRTPLAVTGQTAPGAGDAQFASFGGAALNAAGHAGFHAALTGLGVSAENNTAIWAGTPLALSVIARENATPPGTANGVLFRTLGDPSLARVDQAGFAAGLGGAVTAESDAGLFAGAAGALRLAARKGSIPPGIGNSTAQFTGFGAPALSPAGNIAFRASITGLSINDETDSGIWAGPATGVSLVARAGNAAPGVGNTAVKFLEFGDPLYGAASEVAFAATLIGLGVSDQNDTGIWSGAPGTLRLVARENSQPPGISSTSVQFDSFGPPALSASRAVAFGGTVRGLGISDQNDTGIWAGQPGALSLSAREGNLPPGVGGSGVQFQSFGQPVLNAAGQVAFRATLRGLGINSENNNGIWAGTPGAPGLVIRAGQAAPDTSSGTSFLAVGDPVYTGAGTLTFYATLRGVGVGPDNNAGIWAQDSTGRLRLIVRESETLLTGENSSSVADGGLTLFSRQGGDDSLAYPLVQVLFQARFLNATNGLFIATLGDTAPTITSIDQEDDSLVLQFTGISAVLYAVEYSTETERTHWQTLRTNIPGNGGIVTVRDKVSVAEPARLYRVRVLGTR